MEDARLEMIDLTLFYASLFRQALTRNDLWQRLLCGKRTLTRKDFDKEVTELLSKGFLWEEKGLISREKRQTCGNNQRVTAEKWQLVEQAAKEIRHLPYVRGIGITGSLAFGNCREGDDLDFLIITAPGRAYWGRFFCYMWAIIRQKKRHVENTNEKDKWCFNVFLAEDDLEIPKEKRNLYGAYQLKMLKKVWAKDDCFERLESENTWLNQWFNGKVREKMREGEVRKKMAEKPNFWYWLGNKTEKIVFVVQRNYMQGKMTREILNEKQIFFHPLKRGIQTVEELAECCEKEEKQWLINENGEVSEAIKRGVGENQKKRRKAGWITGTFDLIHEGHRAFLTEALKEVDELWVGLESDERVRLAKGQKRPIYQAEERRRRLQNLFPETTVLVLPKNFGEEGVRKKVWQELGKPKLFINGDDERRAEKAREVKSWRGETQIIKTQRKISMTEILARGSESDGLVFEFDKQQVKKGSWKNEQR